MASTIQLKKATAKTQAVVEMKYFTKEAGLEHLQYKRFPDAKRTHFSQTQ
jgi:hypothetical protein